MSSAIIHQYMDANPKSEQIFFDKIGVHHRSSRREQALTVAGGE
jgi:hypothetical protein